MGSMFLLTYQTLPKLAHSEYGKIGGAYVNCYIEADSFEEANLIARGEIEANLWDIKELDNSKIVSPQDYEYDDENREYFEQAQIDKQVLVFYTYPLE